MKKDFKTCHQEIIDKCKAAGACEPEFKKLVAAKNEGEMWAVLLANIRWCFEKKIFDGKYTAGIKLPKSVDVSIDLSGCDLKDVKIPESINYKIIY